LDLRRPKAKGSQRDELSYTSNKSGGYLETTDMVRRAKPISCDDLRVHNGLMVQPPAPDLETEHSKFRSDLEAVRRYGESHADDYVEELFENEPHIRLIVLMVGDHLAEHEVALRELVDHPNQLEVRRTPFPRSQLEEIRREVNDTASNNSGAFMQRGIARGRVNVQLAADREDLAASFHQRFGDAVELRVGVFPYPSASRSDNQEKEPPAVARPKLPLLPSEEFEVVLEDEIVVSSGGTKSGKLRIHNRGSAEVVIETTGGVTARVVDSQTGDGVGGFVGAQAAPLIKYRIAPGETVSIPLLVGTTSSVRLLGYAVPPGSWAIEVPIQIEGRGKFRTSLLPILILPSEHSL
jgi:hypothetical protein